MRYGITLLLIWMTFFAHAADLGLPPVLKNVKQVRGIGEPSFDQFLVLIETNQNLIERMSIQESEAEILSLGFEKGNSVFNSYDHGTRTLTAGNMQCTQETPPVSEVSILLHEFAHSIFAPNMELAMAAEMIKGKDYLKNYYVAAVKPTSESEDLPADLDTLVSSFDELFADTYSVLSLGNPKAMSDLLESCLGEGSLRDFSVNYPIEGWNVGPLGGMFDRRHELLNPARSYIWQAYTRAFKNRPGGKALLLRAVFDSSMDVVKGLFAKNLTYGQWRSINQEELNKSFVAAIGARLQSE